MIWNLLLLIHILLSANTRQVILNRQMDLCTNQDAVLTVPAHPVQICACLMMAE